MPSLIHVLRNGIITATLFLFATHAFCQKNELSVQVTIKDEAVTAKGFDVQASVTNTSERDQSIFTWSCSYAMQWEIDNPSLNINVKVCAGNVRSCETLKPGEKKEWPLILSFWTPDQAKSGDLTFRLGYHACHCRDSETKECIKRNIHWSEPIKVYVR